MYILYSEFSAHSLFQGKHKLHKNPECKNYIQYSEIFQEKLCFESKLKFRKNIYLNAVKIFRANSVFQAKGKLFKILKDEKYIECSEFRTHSVLKGNQKLLKHSECNKYIKYSEKFHDTLCFQGKRKFLKNPER